MRRSDRSRVQNYLEQIRSLGFLRWIAFKVKRLRSRRAATGTEFSVTTPLADHPVVLRAGTSDTNVFSQIFLHREYRCLDDVADPELIIDCGANVGYASAYLLSRFPTACVIAVEPDPGNYRMLAKNTEPYGSRCRTVQSGVWSSSVPLVVESGESGTRREWAVTVRPAHEGEAAMLMATDIGTLLADSGADRISILKVDIEGSEAEVFARNTEPWIDRVDNLVIELHGRQCSEVVLAAMEGRGFEVSTCEELTVFKHA